MSDCSEVTEVDPTCDSKCPGNSATYKDDKVKSASSYGFKSVDEIK